MKLQVQSYNNGGSVYNAEAEETAIKSYELTHRFDAPAEATIILSDPAGAIAQKYSVTANAVYVGPGKATIEDPDGTDIFYGRIMKAEANDANRTVTLYCQDWLSQLDDEQITYDTREDLDSDDDTGEQGLRESKLHADADNATIIDVAYNDGGGNFYLYDDRRSWNVDEFNGMYVVLGDGMAGKKTWRFFPYDSTPVGEDAYTDDVEVVWIDDNTTEVIFANNDYTLTYHFRTYLGHNTPSNFYVHDSVETVRVMCVHKIAQLGGVNHAHLQIEEIDGPNWVELDHLPEDDIEKRDVHVIRQDTIALGVVDANGILDIRYDVDRTAGNATLDLWYMYVEIDCLTTGYSTPILINDTLDLNAHGGKVNCLEVATDMTAAATRVWDGVPYSIAKKIYLHLESATGPILGYDSMVTLTAGAGDIENTAGISTRQYLDKTPLEIIQDLARQDKSHFWIALGTTTVTYKSTFNDGAPLAVTDTDFNAYRSVIDYSPLVNKTTAYGMRIGDQRLKSTYEDAASIAKYNQTRTRVLSDSGLVSEQDTLARATALTGQNSGALRIISATVAGNTAKDSHNKTMVLGDEVSLTSTYFNLAAAVHIVQRYSYNSQNDTTTLLLHPRVSATGLQADERPSFEMAMQKWRRGTSDNFIPPPSDDVI